MFFRHVSKQQISASPRPSLPTLAMAAHPGTQFTDKLKRTKMVMRLLMFLRHHKNLAAIFEHQNLREIPVANPRIYEKIYREYVFCGASIAERLQFLESHYRFVSEAFSPLLITAMYVERDFPLCVIAPADGSAKLFIRVGYHGRFEQEGDLTLGLYDQEGNRLYSVSFSFLVNSGSCTAVIGCLIGSGSAAQEKRLTKAMHGMRLQNLVVFQLQMFLKLLGVNTLWGIGNDSHVYSGNSRKRDRIKFDYNQFWEELGGSRFQGQRYYILPLDHERRSFQEIRSNKRAMYQRRYAMLDDLEVQMRLALLPPSPGKEQEATEEYVAVQPLSQSQVLAA